MEREFHAWLKLQSDENPLVKLGIGDDAAVLRSFSHAAGMVLTSDAIAEGTHFKSAEHSLELIGRKAMAVNLSDIAAMGATPIAALVTMVLPNHYSLEHAQQIFGGCKKLADEFNVAIIGGDTNRWSGELVVSVTLIGREFATPDSFRLWQMNGAQAGDLVVVSGSFGGSILGHHLNFTPRVRLARHLIQNYHIHAATDVSDSLSLDLNAVAMASHVGVELDVEQIPVSRAAELLAVQTGRSPSDHALTDGEDFELILAVAPSELGQMMNDATIRNELTVVGKFVEPVGFWLCTSGRREAILPRGYSH